METNSLADKISRIAERVVAGHPGMELVHVETARGGGGGGGTSIVRVFIDQPQGITHDDCAQISLELGTALDVEDPISGAYTLEVSSPGLERELYKIEDYRRFGGQLAKIKTRQALNGQRNFRGRLLGAEGEEVLFEDNTSGQVRIPFGTIAKANLEIDIEQEFRQAREREQQQPEGRKRQRTSRM